MRGPRGGSCGVCDIAQHDYNLANASGPNFRAANRPGGRDATLNAGATAPSPTFANQLWYDTSTGYLKKRDNGNTTWQVLYSLDANRNWTFKPGANDRNIDLRNATDQVVAAAGGHWRRWQDHRRTATASSA